MIEFLQAGIRYQDAEDLAEAVRACLIRQGYNVIEEDWKDLLGGNFEMNSQGIRETQEKI